MWFVVLIFPPLVAMLWTLFQIRGNAHSELGKVLVAIMLLLIVAFSIECYTDRMGVFPFVGAKLLHDVVSTALVPLTYYIFSLLLQMPDGRHYCKVQLLCMLLMVPDVIAGTLMLPTHNAQVSDASYNHLQLYLTQNVHMVLQMYNLVIIIQLCIVVWRLLCLRKLLKLRALVFSEFAQRLLTSFFLMAAWIFITMFASHSLLAAPVFITIYMVVYSIMVTLCYVLVGISIHKDLVLNSNKEAVVISKDSDSQLAQDIQLVIERDKVFLNASLRIDDFAAMLMSNRTYVARVFRLKYNGTFTEVMNRYRIEYAKQLMLADPRRRLDEIAYESGFASSSFFGKVFKTAEGKTPSQWRSEQLDV